MKNDFILIFGPPKRMIMFEELGSCQGNTNYRIQFVRIQGSDVGLNIEIGHFNKLDNGKMIGV